MNSQRYLLDANVLIALSTSGHPFEGVATAWAAENLGNFATCPITQGSLLRSYMRTMGKPHFAAAHKVLESFTAKPNHVFIPDDLPYSAVEPSKVLGYKQVTDAYLIALAKAHSCVLATLDRNLAALHPEVTRCLI